MINQQKKDSPKFGNRCNEKDASLGLAEHKELDDGLSDQDSTIQQMIKALDEAADIPPSNVSGI